MKKQHETKERINLAARDIHHIVETKNIKEGNYCIINSDVYCVDNELLASNTEFILCKCSDGGTTKINIIIAPFGSYPGIIFVDNIGASFTCDKDGNLISSLEDEVIDILAKLGSLKYSSNMYMLNIDSQIRDKEEQMIKLRAEIDTLKNVKDNISIFCSEINNILNLKKD